MKSGVLRGLAPRARALLAQTCLPPPVHGPVGTGHESLKHGKDATGGLPELFVPWHCHAVIKA
eukprot:15445327-Alexandrium_andersonii.AAC.1